MYEEESDHKQIFQGSYVVKHEIAKKYFEIEGKTEQKLSKIDYSKYTQRKSIDEKRNSEYLALMEKVKASRILNGLWKGIVLVTSSMEYQASLFSSMAKWDG